MKCEDLFSQKKKKKIKIVICCNGDCLLEQVHLQKHLDKK